MGKRVKPENSNDDGNDSVAGGGTETTTQGGPIIIDNDSGNTGGADSGKDGAGSGKDGAGEAPDRAVDPASAAGPAPTAKRRGRPPGSATKPAPDKERLGLTDIVQLEGTLLFLNGLLFSALKLPPQLQMTAAEAKQQAKAYGDLMAHYGVAPPKAIQLWIGAIGVTATVYAPRIAVIIAMKNQGKKKAAPPEQPNVVDMAGNPISTGKVDFSADIVTQPNGGETQQ